MGIINKKDFEKVLAVTDMTGNKAKIYCDECMFNHPDLLNRFYDDDNDPGEVSFEELKDMVDMGDGAVAIVCDECGKKWADGPNPHWEE